MCHPRYFQTKHQLNPWIDVKQKVNREKAIYQWQKLRRLIENFLGVETVSIEPKKGFLDLVFSADAGVLHHRNFVQANFYHPQREREGKIYSQWFKKNGYQLYQLSNGFSFEGGDFLFHQEKILAGWGFRTTKKAHQKIAKLFGKKVISLKLISPYFYHLDMALCVLDKKTAVFYPQAFTDGSCQLIKKIFPNLITAEKEEAFNFCLNSLVCQKKIISPEGLKGLATRFTLLGFQVKEIDVSEFKKAGGAVHCLIKPIN